jgi:hypothetical protein
LNFFVLRIPADLRVAEIALKQEERKPRFSLQLLRIVHEDTLPVKTRLAAALCFKNFIRLNYVVRSLILRRLRGSALFKINSACSGQRVADGTPSYRTLTAHISCPPTR